MTPTIATERTTTGRHRLHRAATLAGGAAWALLALLERRSRTGRRTWRVTAWAVLAISLLGPFSAGAAGRALASLVAMHLAVGTTLILGLASASGDRVRAE